MAMYIASYLFGDVSCPEVSNSYPLCSFGGKPVQTSRSTCLRRSQNSATVPVFTAGACKVLLKQGSSILMYAPVLYYIILASSVKRRVYNNLHCIYMYVLGALEGDLLAKGLPRLNKISVPNSNDSTESGKVRRCTVTQISVPLQKWSPRPFSAKSVCHNRSLLAKLCPPLPFALDHFHHHVNVHKPL